MKTRNSAPRHGWMDAHIEAYVDGDLPADEHAAFEQVLASSPHWQAQVSHARRIHDALHALPELTCPPQVTDAVLNETRRRANGSPRTRWWMRLQQLLDAELHTGWKPALAGLALVLVVVASSLVGDPQSWFDGAGPEAGGQYTQTEIQQAESEAKWALAYVAQVSQQTGTTVEQEVLEENVAAPMRRALRPLASSDTDANNPNR